MVGKDPFWAYVRPIENGTGWKCIFCEHKYAVKTSVFRIKLHLSKKKGYGVKGCVGVPEDVEKKACDAVSKEETGSSSGARGNGASQINEVGYGGRDADIPQQTDQQRMTMPMSYSSIEPRFTLPSAQPVQEAPIQVSNPSIEPRVTLPPAQYAQEAPIQMNNSEPRFTLPAQHAQEVPLQMSYPNIEQRFSLPFAQHAQETPILMSNPILSAQHPQYVPLSTCNPSIEPWVTLPPAQQAVAGLSNFGPAGDRNGSMLSSSECVGMVYEDLNLSQADRNFLNGLLQSVPAQSQPTEKIRSDEAAGEAEATMVPDAQVSCSLQEARNNLQMHEPRGETQTIIPPDAERGNSPKEQRDRNSLHMQEVRGKTQATTPPRNQLPVVETCTNELMSLSIRRDDGISGGKENVSGGSVRYDFLTGELEGKAFKDGMDKIWFWLMDGISSIGIYGMGGVGKSTMVTQIANRLRKGRRYDVYWITVGHDFSIRRLQNLIAKRIGVILSDEDDERIRATILYNALIERKKSVLILDDLWRHFSMDDVGIPTGGDGCKLIITTRSIDVCYRLNCQEKMMVDPLPEDEAWTLFMKILGDELSSEIQEIAKSVALECAGLPLGIRALAGSMKGVKEDEREWRYTLDTLKKAELRPDDNMEPEVFRILRYSYTRLNNEKLQQCFLYCALFPEDFEINREELIALLIDEEIIGGKGWLAAVDEGHFMLKKLLNVSLLEIPLKGENYVKMHDLIRDMALQELRKKGSVMVESGIELRQFPGEDNWEEDLTKVSIMRTDISLIPSDLSPCCPRLSTLLLSRNHGLLSIGDSFFKHFRGLKVLDVSNTDITKLPDSISDLVCLTGLLARGCRKLSHVPSLAKLRRLKELDLSYSKLAWLPKGTERLKNLRYLNLRGANEMTVKMDLIYELGILEVFIVPKRYKDIVTFIFVKFEAKTLIYE